MEETEIELKFQVPPGARRAVEKAVATTQAKRTRLQAAYFDTEDRRLARAGIGLRLRKEGRRWVQAVKVAGAHPMQRLEHEVPVPAAAGAASAIDIERHAGTPAARALADALRETGSEAARSAPPALRYRIDVMRTARVLRVVGGKVELAFDSGRIVAGTHTLPVCELELELLSGSAQVLIELARRWVTRHGIWLDVHSKAERGDLLASGQTHAPPQKASHSLLERGAGAQAALRAAVRDCLAQMLPNASEIARGEHDDDHVHQLRVGLRRLRSLLRFFGDAWPPAAAAWEPLLRSLFQQLGAQRDREVLEASLRPRLEAAGAPPVVLPEAPRGDDIVQRLRSSEVTLLWLDLLAFGWPQPDTAAADAEPLQRLAAERLQRWHRRLVKQRKGFDGLGEEARHTLRKHAKRLRYAAEFVAPLFEKRAVERYLERLPRLQDCLGAYNDLHVASELYRAAVAEDPRAWFSLGWLAARGDVVVGECAAALRRFAKAKPFWHDH